MSQLYLSSIIRFVPNHIRGEFVNIGVIVGCESTSEWDIRFVQNQERMLKLGGTPKMRKAAWGLLHKIQAEVHEHHNGVGLKGLDQAWLYDLHERHRNIVQFSEPIPTFTDSAHQALSISFDNHVVDIDKDDREGRRHSHLVNAVRSAYSYRHIDRPHLHEQVLLKNKCSSIQNRFRCGERFSTAAGPLVVISVGETYSCVERHQILGMDNAVN